MEGQNTGLLEEISFYQRRKVDLDLRPFLMSPKLYLLNCGGTLEQKTPCGQTYCGINIARGIDLKLLNGGEGHRFGRQYCRLGMLLIKRVGENLGVVVQAYGMIIGPDWVPCIKS